MSKHGQPSKAELLKTTEETLTLNAGHDIGKRKVVDRDGEVIGHVCNLFVDEAERKVRLLEIQVGGFLGLEYRHFLLPIDAIERVEADALHVNQTLARILHSPPYEPRWTNTPTQEFWAPFYAYYALTPYWGEGYLYPVFPPQPQAPPGVTDGPAAEDR